jgi:hypothetical protein
MVKEKGGSSISTPSARPRSRMSSKSVDFLNRYRGGSGMFTSTISRAVSPRAKTSSKRRVPQDLSRVEDKPEKEDQPSCAGQSQMGNKLKNKVTILRFIGMMIIELDVECQAEGTIGRDKTRPIAELKMQGKHLQTCDLQERRRKPPESPRSGRGNRRDWFPGVRGPRVACGASKNHTIRDAYRCKRVIAKVFHPVI